MPTCPSCKHKWTTAKPKTHVSYSEALITFDDGVVMVVGGYAPSEKALYDKAITRRALALSCGRLLDRAMLARVPAPRSLKPLHDDNREYWRVEAMLQRQHWGACLDTARGVV